MAQGVASAPALQQGYREQGGPSDQGFSPKREPHRHTYGAIDLGTNNCRLLVARPTEGGFTVIDAFSRIVRLGEGLARSGELSQEAMDRAVAALSVCADKLRRRNVSLSRSVATEACRRAVNGARVRRAGPRRDRHRPRHHRARGGSAARGARLPQAARAGRRAGADLRHRRRLDRAGADRPGGGHAADPRLVERALGRGLADRERGQGGARRARPARRLRRMRERARRAFANFATMLPESARRHPPARDQRHGDDARQRPSRAAHLRPPRGRRAPRADRGDAGDQRR